MPGSKSAVDQAICTCVPIHWSLSGSNGASAVAIDDLPSGSESRLQQFALPIRSFFLPSPAIHHSLLQYPLPLHLGEQLLGWRSSSNDQALRIDDRGKERGRDGEMERGEERMTGVRSTLSLHFCPTMRMRTQQKATEGCRIRERR